MMLNIIAIVIPSALMVVPLRRRFINVGQMNVNQKKTMTILMTMMMMMMIIGSNHMDDG